MPHLRHLGAIAAILLSRLALAAAPATPPLADRVPSGAVFYVGWPGVGNLKDFNDSRAGHLVAGVDWSAFLHEMMLKQHGDLQGTPAFDDLQGILEAMTAYAWNNPSAIYSMGKGIDEGMAPKPHFTFLIDFGTPDAATAAGRDIQSRLDRLLQGNAMANTRMFKQGSVLAMDLYATIDRNPLDKILTPLAYNPRFLSGLTRADNGGAAAIIYFNLEALWPILDELPDNEQDYASISRISGFKSAAALTLSAAPDQRDWRSRAFIEFAPKLDGVIGALATTRPSTPDLYAGVPALATSANVYSLDPARMLAIAKAMGDQSEPGTGAQIEAWTNLLSGAFAVDLRSFAQDLGPNLTFFSLPAQSEPPGFNFVVMLNPTSADKTRLQLTRIVEGIGRFVTARMPTAPKLSLATEGDITTLSIPTPARTIALSWTSANNHLYFARTPEVLSAVVADLAKAKLSDDPSFKSLLARLAPPPEATLSYANLPAAFPAVWAAWAAESSSDNSKLPPPLHELPIPSSDQLLKESAPALTATWVDAGGLNYVSLTPYPWSELLHPLITLFIGPDSLEKILKPHP